MRRRRLRQRPKTPFAAATHTRNPNRRSTPRPTQEKNRFTKDGWLVVSSTRHRAQAANLDDALAKLQAMIDAAVDAVTVREADPATVKRVQAK